MYCISRLTAGFVILFAVAMAPAQEASPPRGARELFYEAAPATAKPAPPARPAVRPKQPAAATAPATATPPATSTTPPAAAPSPTPAPAAPTYAGNTLPGGGHIVKASAQSGPPLGLRYSIVRLVNGSPVETSPDFVFHSGDHFNSRSRPTAPAISTSSTRGPAAPGSRSSPLPQSPTATTTWTAGARTRCHRPNTK